ncbi:uncharacterized protein BXZ73DRAFT_75912 [Epithele typhae]|uniref:uncharacterized protein n=1 Tax=Epithele typhae TaxID=378194 RepID=UPI0020087BF4|nr:uncharacterized protein BXZ73DRAFT_75912 [Epithele typhae]KAH9939739.1 hypothetical protein BXZ73DRAFT_75912 [Epithele typhae]
MAATRPKPRARAADIGQSHSGSPEPPPTPTTQEERGHRTRTSRRNNIGDNQPDENNGLLSGLRPNQAVIPHPNAPPAAEEGSEEMTHEDVARERGDDDGDEDYNVGKSTTRAAQEPVMDLASTSRFTSLERVGGHHAVPIPPSSTASTTSTPSGTPTVSLPADVASVIQLLSSPALLQKLTQTSEAPFNPSFMPQVSWTSSLPSTSLPSSVQQQSRVSTPTPGTASKRTVPDDTIALSKDELSRIKKTKHNASRARLWHYNDDAIRGGILRHASETLLIYFASCCPFPTDTEREVATNNAVKNAVRTMQREGEGDNTSSAELPPFQLTKKESSMLEGLDSAVRSRAKQAATTVVRELYGFVNLLVVHLSYSVYMVFARQRASAPSQVMVRSGTKGAMGVRTVPPCSVLVLVLALGFAETGTVMITVLATMRAQPLERAGVLAVVRRRRQSAALSRSVSVAAGDADPPEEGAEVAEHREGDKEAERTAELGGSSAGGASGEREAG